jgi:ketosteroid isomerase-like protein
MHFRLFGQICVGTGLGVMAGTAAAQQAPAIPPWAENFLQAWYVAYNSGDAAGVAKFFTPDARFGPFKGRAAIAADLKKAFATARYRCAGRMESLRELGASAVA